MSTHAKNSPSSLAMVAACPSFLPEETDEVHPVTAEGSLIHKALELDDPGMLENKPQKLMFNYARGQVMNQVKRVVKRTGKQGKTYQELKVDSGIPENSGTADIVYVNGSLALVMDFKFSYYLQRPPQVNPQAISYALGVFKMFPKVNRIEFLFIYGRLKKVVKGQFSRRNLERMAGKVTLIIERKKKLAGKEFNPVQGVCDYCANKGGCRALGDRTEILAHRIIPELEKNIDLWDIPALVKDPKQSGQVLQALRLMREHIEAYEKKLRETIAKGGKEPEGYRWKERKGATIIQSNSLAIEIAKEMGVDPTLVLRHACKISITELKKLVADSANHGLKNTKVEDFLIRLREVDAVVQGRGSRYLEPKKDHDHKLLKE